MRIKLCGMRKEEDILTANELKPEYIGYIFASGSPRNVEASAAAGLTRILDPEITPVGVFVNDDPARICRLVREGVIRAVQLHGAEPDSYIRELKGRLDPDIPLIKAFSVRTAEDIEKANESAADYVLLDTGSGGTGQSFDHGLLSGIRREYFLAGGLSPGNITGIIGSLTERPSEGESGPAGFLFAVDVSSGIEADGKKGVKDPEKMRGFTAAVRAAERSGEVDISDKR